MFRRTIPTISYPYTLKESTRARVLRVTVHPGGHVVVTKPRRTSTRSALLFLDEHDRWVRTHIERLKKISPKRISNGTREEYKRMREEARRSITERLEYFNQYYGFSYGRIAIKNMRSRWGSCSGKKNLNFHYRVLTLPPPLRDYIVVHELCHLKEMNHKTEFWELVARTIPDFALRRRALRVYEQNDHIAPSL
jgi:predicted metal-dependent hydrolase